MSTDTDVSYSAEPGIRQISPGLVALGCISVDSTPELPCSAYIADINKILIATVARGQVGEPILCRLNNIGLLSGWIVGLTHSGFAITLDISTARRGRIAARVAWLMERGALGGDQRENPRIVPHHRAVTVRLPDGRSITGQIEDLSKSGAKISLLSGIAAKHIPTPTTSVVVGKRYAVVIRTDGTSIAVQFRLPFTDATFNYDVVL